MVEYKIIKNQYIDEKGKDYNNPYYTIKYKVRLLWFWWRWKYVKHLTCGISDCSKQITNFDTFGDAQRFVERFICGGELYDGLKKEVVEHKTC